MSKLSCTLLCIWDHINPTYFVISSFQDISEYVMKCGGNQSGGSDVELTQMIESANPTSQDEEVIGANNHENNDRRKTFKKQKGKLAVRLVEIGPRMQLRLYKILQGIAEGEVLYHSEVSKTTEEIDMLIQEHKKKKKRPTHKFTEPKPKSIPRENEPGEKRRKGKRKFDTEDEEQESLKRVNFSDEKDSLRNEKKAKRKREYENDE